jgi:uncharacterized membrane protein
MSAEPLPVDTPVQRIAWQLAMASWIALIVLGLAWEGWLAPLRPGGSWLLLKVLPLVVLLPALRRRSIYAMQLSLFVVMLYLLEGSARLFEPMPAALLAAIETALALLFLGAAITYLRPLKVAARRRRPS